MLRALWLKNLESWKSFHYILLKKQTTIQMFFHSSTFSFSFSTWRYVNSRASHFSAGLSQRSHWTMRDHGWKWVQGLNRTLCPRDITGHDTLPRVPCWIPGKWWTNDEQCEWFIGFSIFSQSVLCCLKRVAMHWKTKSTSWCWHLSWRLRPPGTKVEPCWIWNCSIYGYLWFISVYSPPRS